jgi:hypothetical protein
MKRSICWLIIAVWGLSFAPSLSWAQKPVETHQTILSKTDGEAEARRLMQELTAPKLPQTNEGVIRTKHKGSPIKELKVRFEVQPGASDCTSLFMAIGPGGEILKVISATGKPNRYQLMTGDGTNQTMRELSGNQTMIGFAGSDFWVADLGLEFFLWPGQQVLRRETKRGQACDVLESINPTPAPGAYAKVVTWIDLDSNGIVYAEAYDSTGEVMKEFAPKKLQKVRGEYQLESMEIRDKRINSRTLIEFNLEEKK